MEETRNAPFVNGEDRFSRLPDNLIHHILSFIDTKYAVQTCVLSIEFVYMVFMFRDETNIQKLSVRWERAASRCPVIVNVNRWILFAVKQDVQEITIRIGVCHVAAYEIPHRLLNCKSLRKLEIHMYGNGRYTDITLPKSMNLIKLKVLILEGLSFSNVELCKRLISSCPVLENLAVVDCDLQTDNQRNLIVDSVSLKDFEYTCWLNYTIPNIIKLCAPKLEAFNCRYFFTQDFSLENYSPLSSVAFHMVLEDENAETYSKLPSTEKIVYAKRMMKYLGAVYMVKEMTLSSGFLEVLSQAPDLLDCQPPRLCNLYHLGLEMWPTKCCLRSIAYLLKISPHITQLFLESKKSNLAEVGDDWEAGLSSLGMLSHLAYLQIDDVEGCDAEFKILSFLLKRATHLQQVFVSFRSSVGSRRRVRQVKQFEHKLNAVPTASSSIQWLFET